MDLKFLLKRGFVGFALGAFAFSGAAFAGFTDVPEGSKYFSAVEYLENQGVIDSGETFKPDEYMTKAAFYKLMFNHEGYKPEKGNYYNRFSDVPADAWFAPYIQRAFDVQILQYNPDDTNFYPAQPITRAEAVRAGLSLLGVPHDKYVSSGDLKCEGLVEGDPRTYLFVAAERYELFDDLNKGCSPAAWMTRGEAADLIYRMAMISYDAPANSAPSSEQPATVTKPANTDVSSDAVLENGDYKITLNLGSDEQFAKDVEEFVDNETFQILLSVWSKVHDDYVFKDNIDRQQLLYGAIGGLVENLEDPYSEFQLPEEAKAFTESINGNFQGIGASVDMIDGHFTIVSPLKGSPAEKAGLKPNDVVIKVDGVNVEGAGLDEIIDLIRGPKGSVVKLTVRRGDSIMEVNVTRDVITLEYVDSQLKGSNVAYLRISTFAADTEQKFVEEMKKVEDYKPSGLIIDLRNNPGGYLNSTVAILSHFVPKGELVASLKNGDGSVEEFVSSGEGEFGKMKIVVLINDGSASASEIMAGTLQDYGIAKLVGVSSFGKGTVQQVISYPDGSQLKLSIANWFTAKGRNINKIGLEPDLYVEGDANSGPTDLQLERAIEELKK